MKVTIHPLSNLPESPPGLNRDDRLIARLKGSFEDLSQNNQLAERFYQRLFINHPNLRPMFPRDMAAQKKKLTETLALIFQNLHAPREIHRHLARLGASHVDYGTRPEHYPLVCEALVGAMADLAGDAWNQDLQADWMCAVKLVSDAMQAGAAQAKSRDTNDPANRQTSTGR